MGFCCANILCSVHALASTKVLCGACHLSSFYRLLLLLLDWRNLETYACSIDVCVFLCADWKYGFENWKSNCGIYAFIEGWWFEEIHLMLVSIVFVGCACTSLSEWTPITVNGIVRTAPFSSLWKFYLSNDKTWSREQGVEMKSGWSVRIETYVTQSNTLTNMYNCTDPHAQPQTYQFQTHHPKQPLERQSETEDENGLLSSTVPINYFFALFQFHARCSSWQCCCCCCHLECVRCNCVAQKTKQISMHFFDAEPNKCWMKDANDTVPMANCAWVSDIELTDWIGAHLKVISIHFLIFCSTLPSQCQSLDQPLLPFHARMVRHKYSIPLYFDKPMRVGNAENTHTHTPTTKCHIFTRNMKIVLINFSVSSTTTS